MTNSMTDAPRYPVTILKQVEIVLNKRPEKGGDENYPSLSITDCQLFRLSREGKIALKQLFHLICRIVPTE